MEIIPTKALQNKSEGIEFKSTVFTSYKSTKPKCIDGGPNKRSSTASDSSLFDLKRAKHDVIKFTNKSVSSYGKTPAQLAAELAISLGAKQPKKPNQNYKDILAANKMKRKEIDDETYLQQLGKTAQGTATQKYKKFKNAKQKKLLNKPIVANYGVVNPKLGIKKRKK